MHPPPPLSLPSTCWAPWGTSAHKLRTLDLLPLKQSSSLYNCQKTACPSAIAEESQVMVHNHSVSLARFPKSISPRHLSFHARIELFPNHHQCLCRLWIAQFDVLLDQTAIPYICCSQKRTKPDKLPPPSQNVITAMKLAMQQSSRRCRASWLCSQQHRTPKWVQDCSRSSGNRTSHLCMHHTYQTCFRNIRPACQHHQIHRCLGMHT